MFILINLGETNYFIYLYMKLLTGIKKRNFKLLFFFILSGITKSY